MKTFLSIDIDFWNDIAIDGVDLMLENINSVYKTCRTNGIPLSAVANHNQMLSLVDDSKTNQLINIDYHSDLATNNVDNLNCGTWVSYVKNRRTSKYKWLHLNDANYGDCNGSEAIFKGITQVEKRFYKGQVDWGEVAHKEVSNPVFDFKKIINKEFVTQVCICESPSYTNHNIYEKFREWRKNKKIEYKRGLKWDSYEKNITPN